MHFGKMCSHISVTFVGAYNKLSRFGNGKVYARQRGAAGEENLAKMLSCSTRQQRRVRQSLFCSEMLVKQRSYFFLLLVNTRKYDMTRDGRASCRERVEVSWV